MKITGGNHACRICPRRLRTSFDDAVTHYISTHGARLLHVGEETVRADGELLHFTVAVLGLPPLE